MKKGVKSEIKATFEDYDQNSRKNCLLNHCAMAILTVEMTKWTHTLEKSIFEKEMKQGVLITQNQLREVVDLIKSPELTAIQTMTLESLIVLSVHNLDVTKHLQSINITSTNQFSFESQLRYYYNYNNKASDHITEVKILSAVLSFNYEYLGNTSRLVITPLTDRCYRTLCSAISLNYGGAPEGPAGTGKT